MMFYDKSDVRFELSIFENLLLVKKLEKWGFSLIFLGTNKGKDYPQNLGKNFTIRTTPI